jgi:rod shape-determining protein MreD
MSSWEPRAAALRLRGGPARGARRRPVDAEISVAPRFALLALLGVAAVVSQATLLHGVTLRGAHVSLVTVLVVWTGLRCGVVTGGWLGCMCGLLEDALGGGGTNVLGTTLDGFFSGLLTNRFFSDSLPVFLAALAGATAVRFAVAYFIFEFVYGERGLFHPMSHEFAWTALLNCCAGAIVLFALRARSHLPARLR